ncbi:isochorismatase family protein [Nannocystis pusilla]|uniref:Isochorismatase family protein n=1 Tax=Nannocystis pusilla TaxID=889268 RepID=A0A9X3ER31_9BACT|nr:isochorismatase family protein [Nannocystis pusilla]
MELHVPARPAPFRFRPRAAALLVIDMQGDFLLPGGFGEALGNDVGELQRTIAPTRAVLDAARAAGLLVVHTREGHRPDLSDCPPAKRAHGRSGLRIGEPGPRGRILVRGEAGWDIVPELAPGPGEPVIDKPGKGAFHATDLEAVLRNHGIEALFVAGVTTEVCVQSTVREANDRGFRCLVLADCVASYFPEYHRVTLDMIAAQGGIAGSVGTSADVIAALASAPETVERPVLRFYEEALNAGREEAFTELLAPDVAYFNPATGTARGPEGVLAAIRGLRAAFPDLRYTVEELIAEGDRVAARFTLRGTHRGPFRGRAATGRTVEIGGSTHYRVAGGKLTEVRVFADFLGLLRQIGVD